MSEAKQIYTLIPKIMSEIGHVAKGRMAKMGDRGGAYAFRGIDDAYAALQPLLAANGVFIVPRLIDCKRETIANDRGGGRTTTVATVEFDVVAPDGSSITSRMVGEAMDAGDKSASKAQSVAMREMVWKLFCVPTASTEHDPESAPEHPPAAHQRPAANGNGHAAPPPQKPVAPDLSDGTGFRDTLIASLKARGFDVMATAKACGAICEHHRCKLLTDVPADKRPGVIAMVQKGLADKFKRPPEPQGPATPEQVTEFHSLIEIVGPSLPDGEVQRRCGEAGVSDPEEMDAPTIAKLIAFLKTKMPGMTAAA